MLTRIIDTHALVVSDDTERFPFSPLGGEQSKWSAERLVTAPRMIEAMDAAGIERSVLLQSSTAYGFNNDYLVEAVAAYRDRFAGVFSVDILDEGAPSAMRRWVASGLSGMRVFTHGSTLKRAWVELDDERTRPAWTTALDLGLSVSTNAADLSQVGHVMAHYPEIPLILEHVTRPGLEAGLPYAGLESLFALSRHPNLHLKITPRTLVGSRRGRSTPESYIRRLVEVFGSDRIMWGSYYPPVPASLGQIVEEIRDVLSVLKEAQQQDLLHQTAAKVFFGGR